MASAFGISKDSRPLTGRPNTGLRIPDLAAVPGLVQTAALPERPYLLVFYRGHWCSHCRAQLQELAREAWGLSQQGVNIVAISTDDADGIAAMDDLIASAFTLLADPKATLVKEIGIVDPFELRDVPVALPAIYLVDETGTVRYHYVGSAPDDRPRVELLRLAAEQIAKRKC